MTSPLTDPAVLNVMGQTSDQVRTRLTVELNSLEAQLRGRQDDWNIIQPNREWSPAQEAEHILKIDNSAVPVLQLLLSDRDLRPTSQIPGEVKNGKRQSPSELLPSDEGIPFEQLDTTWAAHRQQLEEMAAQVKPTPGRTVWHEFFGEIGALDWLRMITLHMSAHRKLLEESAPGSSG